MAGPRRVFCSRACWSAGWSRPDRPRSELICANCGAAFIGTPGRRFCHPRCATVAHRQMDRDRRRLLRAGMTADRILRRRVFERDGWRCQLCGNLVDQGCVYPDPLSPSLDHRLPVTLGGEHTEANVQLAHLRCNLAKGARVA